VKTTEKKAAVMIHSIASGLQCLHSHGIVHRNLNPNNIVIRDNERGCTPIIIDFSCASTVTKSSRQCGVAKYTAPEVYNGSEYECKPVDIWALGICMFMIIYGQSDTSVLTNKEHTRLIDGSSSNVGYIVRLLLSLINVDPSKRIVVDEVVNDKWLCYYV
jgi:serine/threonine protein kinase